MKTKMLLLIISCFNVCVKAQNNVDEMWFLHPPDTIITNKNVVIEIKLIVKESIDADTIYVKAVKTGSNSIWIGEWNQQTDINSIYSDNGNLYIQPDGEYNTIFGSETNPYSVGINTETPFLNFPSLYGLEVNGQINLTDATWCPLNAPNAANNKINAYRIRGVPVLSVQRQATSPFLSFRNLFVGENAGATWYALTNNQQTYNT